VSRLAAQGAVTTIQFTLQNPLTLAYTIPAGTQAGTTDGQFVFATSADLIVPAMATVANITASCITAGPNANGYLPGQVNVMLSPNVLIASVTNIITTGGGSAPETDDHLRTRIQAAPNQFSVAGPAGAYRFFALGVDPSIIDVDVVSPAPGTVQVYILTGPIAAQPAASPNSVGVANSALLAKVQQTLGADDVRPLTDTVSALAVSEVDYQIVGTITLFADAEPISTMAAVNVAAQDIALNLAARIQRDIVPSEIVAALSVPGVYQVVLAQPSFTQLNAGQWANCTAITLAQAIATEHS
jgi:phage-related baseplate assembly protein